MSKKLIAGAGVVASLAVALAPLATFAAENHTDAFRLNVPKVCTLGAVAEGVATAASDSTEHSGTTWYTTTGENQPQASVVAASGTNGRTDVYAADVLPGVAYDAFGTTVFTVKCNDTTGYTLSAQASSANLTNGDFNIATQAKTDNLTTDGNSYWNFYVSAVSNPYANAQAETPNVTGQEIASGYGTAGVAVPTSATTIVTGHGASSIQNGETITVTYGAGIDTFQESGTYTGSVVYTLAQL